MVRYKIIIHALKELLPHLQPRLHGVPGQYYEAAYPNSFEVASILRVDLLCLATLSIWLGATPIASTGNLPKQYNMLSFATGTCFEC